MTQAKADKGTAGFSWKRLALLLGGLLMLLWLAVIVFPHLIKVPVPDESTFIYEGWLVSQGKLPYRDFFEFIGPGTAYWVGFLIKLFGLRLLALRFSMVLLVAGCMALTLWLFKPLLRPVWRALLGLFLFTVFVPMALVVQHHLYSALLGLLAVAALWRAVETTPVPGRRVAGSGVCVGLCALFTQSLGGLLGIALSGFVLLMFRGQPGQSWRRAGVKTAAWFVLPATTPVVLMVLFYTVQGALPELAYATVGWLMEGTYAKTTSNWYFLDGFTRLISMAPVFAKRPDWIPNALILLLQAFLPWLGMLWAMQVLWLRFPRQGWQIQWARWQAAHWRFLLLLTASLGFFAANFSYPNSVLVALHGWLPYGLAFSALAELSRRARGLKPALITLIALLALSRLGDMSVEAWQAYRMPGIVSYGTVEKQLSPLNNTVDAVMATNAMLTFIHENAPPGENLFVFNGAPELYLLTGQTNPTRYQLLMALYNTPAQIEEAVFDLRRKQPEFIVYNQLDTLNFRHDLRFLRLRNYDYRLYPLQKLLQEEYGLIGQMQNLLIFKRLVKTESK